MPALFAAFGIFTICYCTNTVVGLFTLSINVIHLATINVIHSHPIAAVVLIAF